MKSGAAFRAAVTVHIHGAFRSIGNNVVPQLVCAGKMPLVAVLLRRLAKVLDSESEQFPAADDLTKVQDLCMIPRWTKGPLRESLEETAWLILSLTTSDLASEMRYTWPPVPLKLTRRDPQAAGVRFAVISK